MSDDHIGVKVNGVLYVKLEDDRKLREGWDKADARIETLEAALRGLDDMIVDLDAGHRELHDVSRFINGVLAGWKR